MFSRKKDKKSNQNVFKSVDAIHDCEEFPIEFKKRYEDFIRYRMKLAVVLQTLKIQEGKDVKLSPSFDEELNTRFREIVNLYNRWCDCISATGIPLRTLASTIIGCWHEEPNKEEIIEKFNHAQYTMNINNSDLFSNTTPIKESEKELYDWYINTAEELINQLN